MAERMTTANTGNPVGSVDVRDLYDNAENLDNFSNGSLDAYPDHLAYRASLCRAWRLNSVRTKLTARRRAVYRVRVIRCSDLTALA